MSSTQCMCKSVPESTNSKMQLMNITPLKNEDLNLNPGFNDKVIPRSGFKYMIVFSIPLSYLLLSLVVFLTLLLCSPLQAYPKPTLGLLEFETDNLRVQQASTRLKLIPEQTVSKVKKASGLVSSPSSYFHCDRTYYCCIRAKERNFSLPFTEAIGGKMW